jgi:hypothetical protein
MPLLAWPQTVWCFDSSAESVCWVQPALVLPVLLLLLLMLLLLLLLLTLLLLLVVVQLQ